MNLYEQSINDHLALTQYYRWYQVYELPFTDARIANQLDILADDVEISSMAGTTKGKANLPERLKVYEGWQNAHHVQKTGVTAIDGKHLALEADILYQNIRPDGSRYSYTIHYTTALQLRPNDLPLFTKVDIKGTGNVEPPLFEPAYADNRASSFMHYWLYLMETLDGDINRFKEILAADFALDTGTGHTIYSWEAFEAWVHSIRQQVKASAHIVKKLRVTEQADGTLQVSVDIDWQGIGMDEKPLSASFHHEWVLTNDPDERFARLKWMKMAGSIV